jgi:hypothetical protein
MMVAFLFCFFGCYVFVKHLLLLKSYKKNQYQLLVLQIFKNFSIVKVNKTTLDASF